MIILSFFLCRPGGPVPDICGMLQNYLRRDLKEHLDRLYSNWFWPQNSFMKWSFTQKPNIWNKYRYGCLGWGWWALHPSFSLSSVPRGLRWFAWTHTACWWWSHPQDLQSPDYWLHLLISIDRAFSSSYQFITETSPHFSSTQPCWFTTLLTIISWLYVTSIHLKALYMCGLFPSSTLEFCGKLL